MGNIWSKLKATAAFQFIDVAASSFPIKNSDFEPSKKLKLLANKLRKKIFDAIDVTSDSLTDIFSPFTDDGFYHLAPKLQRLDLSNPPYKRIDFSKSKRITVESDYDTFTEQVSIFNCLKEIGFINNDLIKFILKSQVTRYGEGKQQLKENLLPFLFPTRPYTPSEILNIEPSFSGSASDFRSLKKWAKYVRAVRGTWVSPALLSSSAPGKKTSKRIITIGNESKKLVKIAVTSFKTTNKSWSSTAVGKPDHNIERYKQLCHLINSVISRFPKPDYVVLPELSLPLKWVNTITNRLSQSAIALIAGTEYRHMSGATLKSEALLNLCDNRLGYPIWCNYWQPKLQPAVGEDKELQIIHGKTWCKSLNINSIKPVYIHNGFHFGIMICSELQNSKARIEFQGNVDSLFVLSWNQDLDTFSALLEAAALDVHAYSVLVNNRSYGDSRVRSPAKIGFKRDLARIKGGENDYFVTVTLDFKSLREFQSRATRWTTDDDKFKPVPEGYKLIKSREIKPAK